jgi:predicted O-methyltransferase YrrM
MKIEQIAQMFPEVQSLIQQLTNQQTNDCFPSGHFYSATFSIQEIKEREDKIWKENPQPTIPGVDLNANGQLALLKEFEKYYDELPFDKDIPGLRYQFENGFYSYTDGIILYSMMRHLNPSKIIEVGSGFSSALMLDTKEHFGMDSELLFIEPYPERLNSLLRESDKKNCSVIVEKVQDVNPEVFATLGKNDILFIDSSHVLKTGSDLHYLLFEILPIIQPGVFIHFHDIFYPFEYPKRSVFAGRNWNENYFLRAFLMHNAGYKVRFFSHFMFSFHASAFERMPLCYNNGGGHLWIEKL